MKNNPGTLRTLTIFALLVGVLFAKEMVIVAPYYGNIFNAYAKSGIDLRDTQMMDGVYLQAINTEVGQVNAFIYQAPNVNYSRVTGIHANADYYLGTGDCWLVGLGYDNIIIDMDAGANIPGFSTFKMYNDVKEVYVRFGKYVSAGEWFPGLTTRFLPYIGYGTESVGGSVTMTPGPGLVPVSSGENYPLAGLNGHLSYHHFIEIDAKYMQMYQKAKTLPVITLQANLFFTHNWGLSYQYKYMEQTSGKDIYNILGVSFVF